MYRDELLPVFRAAFAQRPTVEWLQRLGAAGVPHGPIYDVREALEEPHAQARGDLVHIDHPRFGKVRQIASPLRVGPEPNPLARAPLRGEHNDSVLIELCGYSAEEVAILRGAGTFGSVMAAQA